MVLNNLLAKSAPLVRNITTSAVRNSHHDTRGIVGSNLPCGIKNRYALALGFILYFGSGLSVPFLSLRYLILKENSS